MTIRRLLLTVDDLPTAEVAKDTVDCSNQSTPSKSSFSNAMECFLLDHMRVALVVRLSWLDEQMSVYIDADIHFHPESIWWLICIVPDHEVLIGLTARDCAKKSISVPDGASALCRSLQCARCACNFLAIPHASYRLTVR